MSISLDYFKMPCLRNFAINEVPITKAKNKKIKRKRIICTIRCCGRRKKLNDWEQVDKNNNNNNEQWTFIAIQFTPCCYSFLFFFFSF